MSKKPRGFVVWEGVSRIDLMTPVIMVATLVSKNTKTGPMVQVWYLVRDEHPVTAMYSEADEGICGDCALRRLVCYVEVGKAPAAVWRGYQNGIYPKLNLRLADHRELLSNRKVRLGAYGDPAAAPLKQNQRIVDAGGAGHTGYSHQILNFIDQGRGREARGLADLCMVSCDTLEHLAEARSHGLRSFLAVPTGETPPKNTLECLFYSHEKQCADCMLCSGGAGRDIWVPIHGAGESHHTWE